MKHLYSQHVSGLYTRAHLFYLGCLPLIQQMEQYRICMVTLQKQQFFSYRDDYAAATYRYMREYAIKVKQYCTMVSIDDKH